MARHAFIHSNFRLATTLILAAACHLAWAADQSVEQTIPQLAAKLPPSGEVHLALFNDEQPDGFMRLGWNRVDDELVLFDRTMMPSLEIYETMAAAMSSDDLTPRSVSIRFHQGAAIMLIDSALESAKFIGEFSKQAPGAAIQTRPIELEAPADVLLRAVTFILPLVMSQEAGSGLTYEWYAPMGNVIQRVTLTARDGGTVNTPAGAFETVRYELRGGSPENDIYVSSGPNPHIVRIDVLGQPLQFLAPAGG